MTAKTRRISSLYTPLMKILPVPLVSIATVLILVALFRRTLPLFPDGVMVLTWALLILTFSSWYSSRLKFVRMDDDTLYVFSWFKRSAIPLSEVADVHNSVIVGLVIVRLKTHSEFGDKIMFMPTFGARMLSILGSRSIAEELRDLAKKASTMMNDE